MGRKQITGLRLRGEIWHVDKKIKGYGVLRESTGTSDREEAERYLIHRLEEIRKSTVYGERPVRIWREAATKYLLDNQDMPSIGLTAIMFRSLDPFIGDLPLDRIHDGTVEDYVKHRRAEGVTNRTINIALQRVTRVLRLAATRWRDEFGMTWLSTPPVLTMTNEKATAREPYPLSWEEQRHLFSFLPEHVRKMAMYKVNTGCREQEVCKLQWDWEVKVPELNTSVFIIPANFGGRTENSGVKNGEERLVVLNRVAMSIVNAQRGLSRVWVFPYRRRPLQRMHDSGWRTARRKAAEKYPEVFGRPAPKGFQKIRVHDLKMTFGRRLRAAGASHEDRQVLLGHTNGSVTTHYSAAELDHIIKVANLVCETDERSAPTLTILKRQTG